MAVEYLMPSSNFFGHCVMVGCQGKLKLNMFVLLVQGWFKVLLDNADKNKLQC